MTYPKGVIFEKSDKEWKVGNVWVKYILFLNDILKFSVKLM